MRVRDACHPARAGKSLGRERMDEQKTMKITELRAQIERATYDVDAHAVAEAFVSRMLAVHGALRRADVRALLGDAALSEMRLTA
jgi:hypothetical protein